jgi:hypothetical protein
VVSFAQTKARIWPNICVWVTLMPTCSIGGTMLGMGVVGTVIVILVIVWLVRRA